MLTTQVPGLWAEQSPDFSGLSSLSSGLHSAPGSAKPHTPAAEQVWQSLSPPPPAMQFSGSLHSTHALVGEHTRRTSLPAQSLSERQGMQ